MKKNIIFLAACFVVLFIAGNCRGQSIASIKQSIAKTNSLYFELFSKKDLSIVNLYTDDACLLAPNTPAIRGQAALAKDFKDTYAAGQVKGVKFVTENVYGDGNSYVTEEGTWQVFDLNSKVLDTGKYLKLWKKTKTGWKIFRDVFNSDRKGK